MIYLLTGKNGASKTYNATKILLKYWKSGIDVYTNSPMFFKPKYDIDAFGWQMLEKATPDTNPDYFNSWEEFKYHFLMKRDCSKKPWCWFSIPCRGKIKYFEELDETYLITDAVIFYDEGQELFDAQYWESLPKFFKRKLRQHRKDYLDILTTTQEIGQIDKNYRRLIQIWINYINTYKFGSDPRIIYGRFVEQKMDINKLKGNPDIIDVPVLEERTFSIHWWSKKLYDPMWHVNFHFFRIIWIQMKNYKTKKLQKVAITCPRDMSIKTALQTISYMKSPSISKILAN